MRQGYVKMTPVRQGVNPFGYPAHPKDKKQMAFYHCSVKAVQRSKGQTATRCAAYRAGELIHCERTGETHDYRRKTGVMHTEIITPNGIHAPSREQLWNMAELAEKRKDSCVAREYEVALPHELTHAQRTALAQDFCKHIARSYGVAVDLCIHRPTDKEVAKGADPRNFHAHILTTTRVITNDGLGAKADNEKAGRNRKKDLESIRIAWQDFTNEHLAKAGLDERIDHRSHRDRGLDIAPTVKMGVSATAMERKGISTEKGDINRAIKAANAQYREIQNEIAQAQQAQADERDRITRNIAITDRAIESTDRAINATDQDAERRKRSIEQRKRAAATTHSAAGAGQQHTATATDSAAGTHNEVAADDQRAAATRSAADRSIDSAEQHINAAEQHINAAAQDIAAYDRDAERTSGYIRQLNEIDQIEIQPVAHAPKPAEPTPTPAPPPQHEINNIRDGWHEYTEEHAMHNAFSPRYKGNPLANEMKELELKKQCGMGQDEYEKQKKLLDTVASMNADKVNRNQHKYSADEYQQRIKTASILTDAPAPAPEPKPPAPEPKPEPAKTARDDDFDFSL